MALRCHLVLIAAWHWLSPGIGCHLALVATWHWLPSGISCHLALVAIWQVAPPPSVAGIEYAGAAIIDGASDLRVVKHVCRHVFINMFRHVLRHDPVLAECTLHVELQVHTP